jgi:osmotically-inducible protein OsmY
MKTVLLVLPALALTAGVTVFAQFEGGHAKEKSLAAAADKPGPDAKLAARVRGKLLFHKSVAGVKPRVEADKGVVTIRGIAESDSQKELIGVYVKEVEGVKGVRNLMEVPRD